MLRTYRTLSPTQSTVVRICIRVPPWCCLQVIVDFDNTPMYRLWFFACYSCSFILLLVVR